MFRSFKHIGAICCTRASYSWGNIRSSQNHVKEVSFRTIFTWVNVFELDVGIPNLCIVPLPKNIQIIIILQMPQGQSCIKPGPFHLKNHFQGLTNLVHLQEADDAHRDVHGEEIPLFSASYFILAVPFCQSCKICGFKEMCKIEKMHTRPLGLKVCGVIWSCCPKLEVGKGY